MNNAGISDNFVSNELLIHNKEDKNIDDLASYLIEEKGFDYVLNSLPN